MGVVRKGMLVAAMALAAVGAGGCQNKLAEENKALWAQNRELQAKYGEAANQPKPDPSQVNALHGEIAARDAKISELEAQLRQPTTGPSAPTGTQLAGIEATMDQATGNLTVNIPGDVLFDAGRASLKESSKSTLNKIAAAIKKEYAGKHVFVDGHTDADPITKTKGMWQDNLDLSAERARAVAKYLSSQGIDHKNVDARAYGSTQPKKSKEASRRVEIVVATR
jgi:flagellar motor protein MotB